MSVYLTESQYNDKSELQYIPIYLDKLKPFICRTSSNSCYLNPNYSFIIIELNHCWSCQMKTNTISRYSLCNQLDVSLQSDDWTTFYNIKKIDKRTLTKIQEHYPDHTIHNNQIYNYSYNSIHCNYCKLLINNPFLLTKLMEPYVDPLNITYKGNVSVITLDGYENISITADYRIKVTKMQYALFLQHNKNKRLYKDNF